MDDAPPAESALLERVDLAAEPAVSWPALTPVARAPKPSADTAPAPQATRPGAPAAGSTVAGAPTPQKAPAAQVSPVAEAAPASPGGEVADEPADVRAALTEREAAILRFEHRTWRYRAAKDEAIRVEFGISPARYYQLLNVLIEKPAALAAEPVLVGRLARLRSARRQGWTPAAMPTPRLDTRSGSPAPTTGTREGHA